jgi:hypothetical protein
MSVADGGTNGGGSIASLLSGALATLTATATTVGAATGGLAFLLRNTPTFTFLAAVLAIVSAVLAVVYLTPLLARRQTWRAAVLVSSAALLFASLAVVVWSQSELLKVSSRPDISVEWVRVDAGDALLRLAVNAQSVARDDVLYSAVVVLGREPDLRGGTGGADPRDAGSPRAVVSFTLYSGSTGPDSDGHARQVQEIAVPRQLLGYQIRSVQIAAAVIEERQLADWSAALNRIPTPTARPSLASGSAPGSAASGPTMPDPVLAPRKARITSLDCDGRVAAIDSTSGLPVTESLVDIEDAVSCVNVASLPEPMVTTTGTRQ